MHRLLLSGIVVAWLASGVALGQHHTARFFTNFGRPRKLMALAFSPQGEQLAVAPDGGPVVVLNTATGDTVHEFKCDPFTMVYSADGKQVLAAGELGTRLLNVRTGKESHVTWRLPTGYVGCRFQEKNGKLVIEGLVDRGPASESGQIHVGDELTGMIEGGRQTLLLGKRAVEANKLLTGPAGTEVILQIVPKGTTKPLDVSLRRKPATMERDNLKFQEFQASFSAQAGLVVSSGSLVLLDANTGNPVSALRCIELEQAGQSAVSPDGRRFAFAARRVKTPAGESELALEVFDVKRQQRTHFAPFETGRVNKLRFTADGHHVLVGGHDTILVYDLEKEAFVSQILIGFDPRSETPENNEDPGVLGVRMAAPAAFGQSTKQAPEGLVVSFDIMPDSKLVAVGTQHGECLFWSTERHVCLGALGEKTREYHQVHFTTLSRDGKWVAFFVEGTLHWASVKDALSNAGQVDGAAPKP